ncbi:hypothetical protein DFH07DRAFT_443223 [Mycena maculata]|uniref:Uncharacterized protein n=1 Tax=Mycena maculata TaxID=230809 RepID=A0AAD7NFD1_9AGAR|nr:hypothetical protein DFH07DRAFT_443223 [Mycena maculata]
MSPAAIVLIVTDFSAMSTTVSPSRLPGSSGAPEAALITRLHPSSGYPQNRPFSYVNCSLPRFIGVLGAPIVARLHPSGGNPEIDFLTMSTAGSPLAPPPVFCHARRRIHCLPSSF